MTTRLREVTDLDVCTTCLLLIANGEHGDCDGTCISCTATPPPGWWPVIGDAEDLGFSARACELCGDHLAGDRHRAALISR